MINFDVVIIGSGLAGLSTALKLADNKKIAITVSVPLTIAQANGLREVLRPPPHNLTRTNHIFKIPLMQGLDCVMKRLLILSLKKVSQRLIGLLRWG